MNILPVMSLVNYEYFTRDVTGKIFTTVYACVCNNFYSHAFILVPQ